MPCWLGKKEVLLCYFHMGVTVQAPHLASLDILGGRGAALLLSGGKTSDPPPPAPPAQARSDTSQAGRGRVCLLLLLWLCMASTGAWGGWRPCDHWVMVSVWFPTYSSPTGQRSSFLKPDKDSSPGFPLRFCRLVTRGFLNLCFVV